LADHLQRSHDIDYVRRMKSNSKPIAPFPELRFVFLDRDGVVNRKAAEGKYICNWSEFEILPGVEEAIAKLGRLGCRVFMVSNQRGIALGLCSVQGVNEIHEKLRDQLAASGGVLTGIYFCPHDKGACECRKPGTGLFKQAVRDFPEITPEHCVMIGDSLSDIEAARGFGCRSIYIEGDPNTQKPGSQTAACLADGTAGSLLEAVNELLVE
jgi:D-glycero-D-manno-heptose 1,7-bisphosphate phosphatase